MSNRLFMDNARARARLGALKITLMQKEIHAKRAIICILSTEKKQKSLMICAQPTHSRDLVVSLFFLFSLRQCSQLEGSKNHCKE